MVRFEELLAKLTSFSQLAFESTQYQEEISVGSL